MAYTHDVFISYRREKNEWTAWAVLFKRALESCLQRELGDPARVHMDLQTPVGVNFVNNLANNLAGSKIIVALLSKDYFHSQWCVHELDLTMERAQGNDIIIPIVVHDGQFFPDAVAQLQSVDLSEYSVPGFSKASPKFTDFGTALVELAPRIAEAIEHAPAYDDQWIPRFTQRLASVYAASKAGDSVPPTQFVLKASPPPTNAPRLKL